jgi:hypothetical protein
MVITEKRDSLERWIRPSNIGVTTNPLRFFRKISGKTASDCANSITATGIITKITASSRNITVRALMVEIRLGRIERRRILLTECIIQ